MLTMWKERRRRQQGARRFARTYLEKVGWFESYRAAPRNREGHLPWITYPALRQLERLVRPDMRVFEYGCGSSSLWWAARVAEVASVEHDPAWAAKVLAGAPANLSVTVRAMGEAPGGPGADEVAAFFAGDPDLPLRGDREHDIAHGLLCPDFTAYAAELARYGQGHFDVIVVDGMARSLCAWMAARHLRPGGIIVFDNSDRWQYNAGYRLLREAGFHRIDFYGPGPVNLWEWCTSIFVADLQAFAGNVESPRGDNDLGW